jgi:hypothetical protein
VDKEAGGKLAWSGGERWWRHLRSLDEEVDLIEASSFSRGVVGRVRRRRRFLFTRLQSTSVSSGNVAVGCGGVAIAGVIDGNDRPFFNLKNHSFSTENLMDM